MLAELRIFIIQNMNTIRNKKFVKVTIFVSVIVVAIVLCLAFWKDDKNTIYMNSDENSPVTMVGGGGERIYLKFGQIFGFKDDPKKEYRIVAMVIHVTRKQLDNMIFFDTPKEAEKAGYKPSEDFKKAYDCVKQGKDLFECSDFEGYPAE